MRFGSVCSGIEAASVAWHPLGWKAAWLAEIEPFPSAVLAHHYPTVPNLGDMTTITRRVLTGEVEAPDVFTGGTPCQAFSVAGLRRSLDDARGNLSLTFCEIADAIDHVRVARGDQPAVIVWENVPGVLSTQDNAFGCFLAGLAGEDDALVPPGGKWTNAGLVHGPARSVAWRTLDAQYFGVAQRRRRVFVVASARKGFDPAAVLFEWDRVRRDSAPRREAGKDTAGSTGDGVARCVTAGEMKRQDWETCTMVAQPASFAIQAGALRTNPASGPDGVGVQADHAYTLEARAEVQAVAVTGEVFHTLRAEGFDASEDGTGRGAGAVAVGYDTLEHKGVSHANAKKAGPSEALRRVREIVGEEAFCLWCFGVLASLRPTKVLRVEVHGKELRSPTFSRNWLVHNALSRPEDGSAWLMQSLCEAAGIGCPPQGWELAEQFAGELGAYLSELSQPGAQEARFMRDLWASGEGAGLLRQALSAVQEMGRSVGGEAKSARSALQVRRLTCEEAEFLQGFPRGYTAIPWRGKPADQCPDGPRYKALGNSWAVPCARWIGRRIAEALA